MAGPVDPPSPCFHSDLGELFNQHQPEAWFFGLSHYGLCARIGATDLRNVANGHPQNQIDDLLPWSFKPSS